MLPRLPPVVVPNDVCFQRLYGVETGTVRRSISPSSTSPAAASMASLDTLSIRAGLAATQPIGELMRRALAHPELISLAAGFVDQVSLPVEATHEAVEAVLKDPRRAKPRCSTGRRPGICRCARR